jgi:hypothetical protein
MRKPTNGHAGHKLSRFLLAYLALLLSALMLAHVLQPEREGTDSSSRSPVHQGRQKAAKEASTIQAGPDRQALGPSRSCTTGPQSTCTR